MKGQPTAACLGAGVVIASSIVTLLAMSNAVTGPGFLVPAFCFGMIVLATSMLLVRSADATIERQVNQRHLYARLVEADVTRRRFWSTVSHELRTPLNTIMGYSELLGESTVIQADEGLSNDVDRIVAAGHDLLMLIDDVLSLSDTETQLEDPVSEVVDIGEMLYQIESVVLSLAEQVNRGLEIVGPPAPANVLVDSKSLERLLLLLATQTLKHDPVTHGRIETSLHTRGTQSLLRVEVAYHGTINQATADAYNQLVSHADHGRLRSENLGLARMRQLVDTLHASFSAFAAAGKIEIHIDVPVTQADRRESGSWRPFHQDIELLVIDEVDDSAQLLARQLRRLGARATMATDGATGKQIATALRPEAIILNLDMATLEGLTLLKHLKIDERSRDIPVLACSIRNQAAAAMELGAARFLQKPIHASTLLDTLSSLIPNAIDEERASCAVVEGHVHE